MLTASARRKATIRVFGAVDGGFDVSATGESTIGAVAGVRLFDVVELGGGVRHVRLPDTIEPSVIGVGYAGFLFNLDAPRRFSVPLAVEAGAGSDVDSYLRLRWGLRVRLTDHVFAGLYPVNPTRVQSATSDADGDPDGDAEPVNSYPTSIELGFAF
jgi:hypothetical protein